MISNDEGTEWRGTVIVARRGFDGALLARHEVAVGVPARGSVTIPLEAALVSTENAAAELLLAELDGVRAWWFFTEPRDSRLQAPALRVETEPCDDELRVTVTADVLVRDLTILADKLDAAAVVDDGLITLLPGESHVFRIRRASRIDRGELLRPGVVRTANELVAS